VEPDDLSGGQMDRVWTPEHRWLDSLGLFYDYVVDAE
jgi:hypothetical protein